MKFDLWRPSIKLSSDGVPLAISASDLLLGGTFPHDRLQTDGPVISFFMKPMTPILLCLLYLITEKYILPHICRSLNIEGKSFMWKCVFAVHNFALAIFSFIVWVNSWPIVLQHFYNRGLQSTYCDQDGELWDAGLGGLAIIFYLSKYWEFLDTFVLIIKNKKPSFLQLYHHVGVVFSMWGAVVSQGTWVLIIVLLNSGIHTLMYTYFTVKTIWPQMQIKQAKYLTSAQILQFFTGVAYTLPLQFLGRPCDSDASRMICLFTVVYAIGLIVLFKAFAKRKYGKKKEN